MRQLLFLFLICFSHSLLADSPLTSCNFSGAYTQNKYVSRAKEKGLDKKVLKFLGKDKSDDVIKIAIINELGWNNKGTLSTFENYLIEKRSGVSSATFDMLRGVGIDEFSDTEETKKLSSDDLVCWAYLQAMDDYFDPSKAIAAASLAYDREKESMAHAAVYGLIMAQIVFDQDWCMVYETGTQIFEQTTYTKSILSKEAITMIMDYLNLYKEYC